MKNKIILSHPTGNANVRAIANSLVSKGLLSGFYTAIASYPGNIWDKLGKYPPLSEFGRRSFNPLLQKYTHTHPARDLGRAIAKKLGFNSLIKNETGIFSVDKIYHSIDKKVASGLKNAAKNGVTAVYAYEDGALETFKEAKKLGLKCIYDLPIAYWETGRKIMEDDVKRLPEWAFTFGGGIEDSEPKLQRKKEELELADVVVGPGYFVLDSLPHWAKSKKLIMSPFGSPQSSMPDFSAKSSTTKPLRVLFAGSMGQRKGLGDLFAAMKLLDGQNIELVVLGSLLAPLEFYKGQYSKFIYEPSRPHNKVLELMRSCDVFCLPSLVEGRALVMQEAMSQGLPIIITANTGGSDLVVEGETGFLIPVCSPNAIAEKLTWFLNNKSALPQMGKNAYNLSQKYTWENYGNTVVDELESYL